ncbi:MAG: hypothetical protein LBJ02_12000 [Bifidobacteriaceae bacterium]|jgi:hypothetical protein|nr:hypothetical protein [Bifidobacteriaceae bacterium]
MTEIEKSLDLPKKFLRPPVGVPALPYETLVRGAALGFSLDTIRAILMDGPSFMEVQRLWHAYAVGNRGGKRSDWRLDEPLPASIEELIDSGTPLGDAHLQLAKRMNLRQWSSDEHDLSVARFVESEDRPSGPIRAVLDYRSRGGEFGPEEDDEEPFEKVAFAPDVIIEARRNKDGVKVTLRLTSRYVSGPHKITVHWPDCYVSEHEITLRQEKQTTESIDGHEGLLPSVFGYQPI